MSDPFRDDEEAALARAAALQRELERTQRERDELATENQHLKPLAEAEALRLHEEDELIRAKQDRERVEHELTNAKRTRADRHAERDRERQQRADAKRRARAERDAETSSRWARRHVPEELPDRGPGMSTAAKIAWAILVVAIFAATFGVPLLMPGKFGCGH